MKLARSETNIFSNNVATTRPTTLGLCSGIGMLEEAVRLVFPGSRCAALCEWEAYAAATLLARMADQSMESAPVWCGDLRDFDAAGFRGVVDILTAGLPCQPYSVAGKKQGNTDSRSWGEDGDGPIPGFLRIVDACRPAVVFLENVPTWVRAGWFRPVGDELSKMGYKIVEPVFLAASDVGASHQRKRVFVLAVAKDETGGGESAERKQELGREDSGGGDLQAAAQTWPTPGANDMKGSSREGQRRGQLDEMAEQKWPIPRSALPGSRPNLKGGKILEEESQKFFAPAQALANGATSCEPAPTLRLRLNPAFVAWLMGWPWWWTRPEPTSFGASEMALWRSKLRLRLWSFCGGQE